jgi:hypothetical protein
MDEPHKENPRMKLTKQSFRKQLLAVVLVAVLFTSACSTAWLATFDGYLKIAGPILIQILDIVSVATGTGTNPTLQAKINGDAAALTVLANSVEKATSASIPNACAAFNAGVSTLAGDWTAIEQIINAGPKASGEITAAMGIAQATIAEIEAPLTACQNAPTPAAAKMVLQSAALRVTSPNDVLKRYNAVVDSKHRVHLHSAPVRFLTLGKLQ